MHWPLLTLSATAWKLIVVPSALLYVAARVAFLVRRAWRRSDATLKGMIGMAQAVQPVPPACPGKASPACACDGSCSGALPVTACLCPACVNATIAQFPAPPGTSGGGGGAGSGAFSGTFSPAVTSAVTGRPAGRTGRASHAGVPGFDGAGQGDYALAIGCVRGLRQWRLPIDAYLHAVMASERPPAIEELWPAGGTVPLLTGVTGRSWNPGVNEARCNNYPEHVPPVEWDDVRKAECGCVSPETRVLTADLRWVPAGDLAVGEHLLAFDEYPEDHGFGRAGGRKYRDAVVASTERGKLPCYDLRFSDGTAVRVSADHQWLCYSGQKGAHWVRTDELRAGEARASRVVKPFTPWLADLSYEAGYLAAAFDGEGHIHQRAGQPQYSSRIGFAQVDNEMLAQAERFLKALGFSHSHRVSGASPGQALRVNGTPRLDKHELTLGRRPDLIRFLGEVRPVRLLAGFRPGLLGRLNMGERVRLAEKAYAGEQEVVKLGTTAGTYFAEGLASHNCGFWAYWSIADRSWYDKLPVFGVVEGTGRVLIGTKGFRCQQARIVALVPAFTIEVSVASIRSARAGSGLWSDLSSFPFAAPELSPEEAVQRDRELREAQDRAQAWMGVIMELLGRLYPEARVFATLKGMLASVPLGEVTE